MNRLKNYINGAWAESSSNETVEVHKPATQEGKENVTEIGRESCRVANKTESKQQR